MCSELAVAWIRILTVKGVGSGIWSRLARKISPQKIAAMLESQGGRRDLGSILGRRIGHPSPAEADRILQALDNPMTGAIALGDVGYPRILEQIDEAPPLLFYLGDPGALDKPAACIVGSRKSSHRGKVIAGRIASGLVDAGFLIVSGMARGIDSSVHEGALRSGGKTVAVLGCGIDVAYPPENAGLAIEISRSGCLLSELPPGTPPMRHNFPRRNRILSGLSLGVIVVEAGAESGAMGTAGWAADQGREVFAVPGPIDHPGSRGPHRLIRDGACLIEDCSDILEILRPEGLFSPERKKRGVETEATQRAIENDEERVLRHLDLEPKHIDEIVRICHISATSAMSILLGLELDGIARSCGGGRWARAE